MESCHYTGLLATANDTIIIALFRRSTQIHGLARNYSNYIVLTLVDSLVSCGGSPPQVAAVLISELDVM